ncbi:CoxG family protein [Pseudophaeobacter flagellatus]|uniref:CoxG family protein n=1 Tax=Pseudophaeobacter flagellatus TaxID=2899119 RepID=UPI001E420E1F|nr:carbon monoxide dehydrogenase subunit G [Pseudophaeobacter flagellatus]MCD9148156.1 carbon monoxide dehydrogenase subunit G [Pseudophaeobacter flagellatus]
MQMSDSKEIAAPPAEVYAALLNPEVLKACVPGAQEVSGSVEDGFEASVTQKVGPVKATFKGQVTLSDLIENEKLTITGEGKGGAAGFAKGGAVVSLTPSETGTLLSYEVEAKVGGKLAQLGSRIIDGFAKKMADQFFVNLQTYLAPADPPETAASDDVAGEDAPQAGKKGWFKKITGN